MKNRPAMIQAFFVMLVICLPLLLLGVQAIRNASMGWPVGSLGISGWRFAGASATLSGPMAVAAGSLLIGAALWLALVMVLAERKPAQQKLVDAGIWFFGAGFAALTLGALTGW